MNIYGYLLYLLPNNFHKTSRILFNIVLDFVCEVTILAFYEHSSGAEANVTLFFL